MMWQWELTNRAHNDLAVFKRVGVCGFGVVLGDFLGHQLLIQRFHTISTDSGEAVKAYENWPVSSGEQPVGIFSIGHPLIPAESFHGILFSRQDGHDEVFFYSYANGSPLVQISQLERLETNEQ